MSNIAIFLMGVSGAGKRTVADNILLDESIVTVNTTTTRPMRPGEVQGDKYNYVSDEEFAQLLESGDFVEHALVHQSYYYGTRKSLIEDAFSQGHHVMKEVDMYGREKILANQDVRGFSYSIFMNISDEEMRRRILERNPATSEQEIEKRITSAQYERAQAQDLCDFYLDVEGMTRDEQAALVKQLIDYIIWSVDE